MRNFLLILVASMSVLLSACNDDNKDGDQNQPHPPTTNCKVHCAP